MIVWSEAHLRRVLKEYTSYYNAARTHLGLQKDAPHRRPIERLAAASSLATSCADFTINTVGFSFRNGQGRINRQASRTAAAKRLHPDRLRDNREPTG